LFINYPASPEPRDSNYVCPLLHLSGSGIVKQQLNVLSYFLQCMVAQSLWFSRY